MLCTLSLAIGVGNSACVEPWQDSHCIPPCPLEKRYRESPVAGVLALVAKVVSAGVRRVVPVENTEVYARVVLVELARPVWQF